MIIFPLQIWFFILQVSLPLVSCQRRQGWVGNNGHSSFNNRPSSTWNSSPFQGSSGNNRNPGSSCSRPEFEDDSELIIDRCKSGRNSHEICADPNSKIPSGWKVFMGCKRRRKQYLFPSTCSQSGEWQPKLYNSCEELLRVFPQIGTNAENSNDNNKGPVTAYRVPLNPSNNNPQQQGNKPSLYEQGTLPDEILDTDVTSFSTDDKQIPTFSNTATASPQQAGLKRCPMLYMKLTENFLFTCSIPGEDETDYSCLTTRKTVPSGSVATLKCKPPFYSSTGNDSHWTCTDGTWFGNFNYRLKCYFSQSGQPSSTTKTTTTPSPVPFYPAEDQYNSQDNLNQYQTQSQFPDNPPTTSTSTTTTTTQRPTTTSTTTEANFEEPPRVLGVCPPLQRRKEGVELECVYKTSEAVTLNKCETLQPEGAEAKYSCGKHYESTAGLVTMYRKCKADGSWSGSAEGFNCVIECGRNNEIFTPFIVSGTPSTKGQWPWHSAIYLKETIEVTNNNKKWTYICGGTLISKYAVATAAHCVTFSESPRVRNASHFKIDLGRFLLDDTDDIVQQKDVASIHVHPSYTPYGGYDSDIALVILKESVTIGHHVRPICFPQTLNSALEELQVSESSTGTVVGWGRTEEDVVSNSLLMAELKVGSQRDCSESETGRIQPKSTTFCAKATSGSKDVNVCRGDSGGGMYFPLKNTDFTRWYLQGIVSVGRLDNEGKCKADKYSVFTRVGRYADWIVRVLSEQEALR